MPLQPRDGGLQSALQRDADLLDDIAPARDFVAHHPAHLIGRAGRGSAARIGQRLLQIGRLEGLVDVGRGFLHDVRRLGGSRGQTQPGIALLAQAQRNMGRGQAPVRGVEILCLQTQDLRLRRGQRAAQGLALHYRHLELQFDFIHLCPPLAPGMRRAEAAAPRPLCRLTVAGPIPLFVRNAPQRATGRQALQPCSFAAGSRGSPCWGIPCWGSRHCGLVGAFASMAALRRQDGRRILAIRWTKACATAAGRAAQSGCSQR